jgi:hypothetical protein
MAEYCDLYDENRNPLGRTHNRDVYYHMPIQDKFLEALNGRGLK